MKTLDLTQKVQHPTHFTPSGQESTINLCFLSQPGSLVNCSTTPPLGNSDHKSLTVVLKCAYSHSKILKICKIIWNYKEADKKLMCDMMHNTNWNALITGDVDLSWQK